MHPMQTIDTDVVIVGGGLAGLATAALVARAGLRATVCERAGGLGGRARTQDRDGFLMNQGPHAVYAGGPAARLLADLEVAYTGHAPAVSGGLALDGGRLHTLPGGAVSLLTTTLLGLGARVELAGIMARLPRVDAGALAGTAVDAWIARTARQPAVRRLLAALVRLSTYCDAPATLDAGLAVEQLQLALRDGVRYVDGGWQRLVDGVAARARAAGVELHTGTTVTALHRAGAVVDGVVLRDGAVIRTRAVVVALDAGAAAPLLPDGAARRAAAALGIDRPLYCSVHSAAARLAPGGGALIHVARYLGDERPEPAAVEAELEDLLDRVQPGWRERVVARRFLPDMVAASALATAAQRGRAGRPDVVVAEAPGLFLAGDWVGPDGWLLDASLASARRAADAVVAARAGAVAA
jgi:phytoene dehydrogenase-like protein